MSFTDPFSWRLSSLMPLSEPNSESPRVVGFARPAPVSWQRWGLAAAAAIVLAIAGLTVLRDQGAIAPSDAPTFRADDGSPIASLLEPEAALPREAFELRWSGPAGARYEVTVTTLDLQVLHVAPDVEASELRVPAEALAGLAAGEAIVWRIAGRGADGARLPARTFTQRLE